MLDGKGTIEDYVRKAKFLGMDSLAITDHGLLAGAPQFYWECKANDINPIIGEEFYFVPNAKQVKDEKIGERFHVVILARNEDGYKTLVKLSTESHRNYYYKPVIDRPLLESLGDEANNLTVLSGCAASVISRILLKAIEGDADEELKWWRKIFPNFYIELQHHKTQFDRKLNKRLLKLAHKHGLPWVITNDPHYVDRKEHAHHDALLAIQTASDIDSPDRFRFDGTGYHLRSAKEIKKAFASYGKEVWVPGCVNTVRIAKESRLQVPTWETPSWHIPKFPGVDDSYKRLKQLAYRSLRRRGLDENPQYTDRLKHELREIKKTGIADALLITRDAIRWANKKGIPVGPGRGSVAGCLVGYLVGVHKIDSVKYNLLFERFLNPERPKMPDIDTDFASSRRDEMFTYTNKRYGKENVVRVAAYQKMLVKSAFKSLAKAHGIKFQDANRISAGIIEDDDGSVSLPDEIIKNYPDLVETLGALKGIKKGISRHAAGVIIFSPNDPVRDLVPEMWITSSKQMAAQFDLDICASMRLFKNDWLGLRTLDTINECIRMVKQNRGEAIYPDSWIPDEEPNDNKVYKMLAKGEVQGVFQIEGSTNRLGIQDIQCSSFEDIVACTSLYRAGPINAGAPARYLRNKKDGKIRVTHPRLMMFLKNTWGEMIYQEQMFEILHNLAGFSWSRVDDAKTAMTKKDAVKMAALKEDAIQGFIRVGQLPEGKAEKVWEMIAAQATYLFNRAHAVAYSFTSYQTARLKHLYPMEFLAALLSTVENKDKREGYLAEALRLGFKLLPPDINLSGAKFTASKKGIRFGFLDIKGVGEKAAQKVLEGRSKAPYASVEEVARVVGNKGVVEALRASGAFECLGVVPTGQEQEERLNWQFQDVMEHFRTRYAPQIKLPKTNNGPVCIVGEITKCDKRKTKDGRPFATWTLRYSPAELFNVSLWEGTDDLWDLKKGSIVRVKGRWKTDYKSVGVSESDQVKIIKRVSK